ncbi:hypothetical protein [Paenibacillus sp. FSL H7-0331]|uniref:hypothetical protein n=1 Tax=Paenibacillus sp. FSL H7-0331 TaxID=1920421 RepID=UPI0015C3453F|nr:hypothetical protein [Paenibacillus sp. FSL H7-0331]
MSNENESKDLKLEDLEKPLTEQEMKETTGGGKWGLIIPGAAPHVNKRRKPGGSN